MRHILVLIVCLAAIPSQAAFSVIDADGKVLTLSAPAQRIVSLAPHFTDMLQSIGAGSQIIAVNDDHDSRGRHSRSLDGYMLVGDAAALNYERIVVLKPDLVLAWGSGTPRAWIAQLRQLGLPVFVMEANTLPEIGRQLELLGHLAGREADAAKQQAAYTRELSALQAYARGGRLRYFYQVWSQPLYSLGRQHLLSQALALCGKDNIVPEGAVMAPLINPEFVLAADPDLIFFGQAEAAAARAYWGRFSRLQAVRKKQLRVVDDRRLTRPGPDMVRAVSELCAQLSVRDPEMPRK